MPTAGHLDGTESPLGGGQGMSTVQPRWGCWQVAGTSRLICPLVQAPLPSPPPIICWKNLTYQLSYALCSLCDLVRDT